MEPSNYPLTLYKQACQHRDVGDLAEAERCSREALACMDRGQGSLQPDYADLLEFLGSVLESAGRLEEAEQCARRAVSIMDRLTDSVEGPESDYIALRALQLLGSTLREQGQFEEAEVALRRALTRSYGFPGEPGLIANACNNLAILYKQMGQFTDAESLYRRALQLTEAHAGEQHRAVAVLCHNLGGLAEAVGRPDEAAFWYERARAIGAGQQTSG